MESVEKYVITSQPLVELQKVLTKKKYSSVCLLSDTNTAQRCVPLISSLPFDAHITIPEGEEHKNFSTCVSILEQLSEKNFDRHSLLIIVGGGVLGDMGGFCASIYKRGIDFVLVPTTLLAMVDASVGGKLGIDLLDFKNQLGVFNHPVITIVSPTFLGTLPKEEWHSGFAEVIKHYLLSDKVGWQTISQQAWETISWEECIRHSLQYKSGVVFRDPQESGERKVLNLGHTVGHAIESYFLQEKKPMLHGYAVALGLLIEQHISVQKGWLSMAEYQSIADYIKKIFSFPPLPDAKLVWQWMQQDKKNKDGEVRIVLLKSIGEAVYDVPLSFAAFEKSYHSFLS